MRAVLFAITLLATGCSTKPGTDSLHESFVQQLQANKVVKEFNRQGDDMRFVAPGANGEDRASWRVHIDSAEIQENTDPAHPFKGLVKSSWYANDQLVKPRLRDSNLPLELTSNGLAQECWALWDNANGRWGWE